MKMLRIQEHDNPKNLKYVDSLTPPVDFSSAMIKSSDSFFFSLASSSSTFDSYFVSVSSSIFSTSTDYFFAP